MKIEDHCVEVFLYYG